MLFYKDKRIAELSSEVERLNKLSLQIQDRHSEALEMVEEKDELIADLESYIEDLKQSQIDYSVTIRRIKNILKDIEL